MNFTILRMYDGLIVKKLRQRYHNRVYCLCLLLGIMDILIRKRLVSKDEILFLMLLLYFHSKTELDFITRMKNKNVYFDMNEFMESKSLMNRFTLRFAYI